MGLLGRILGRRTDDGAGKVERGVALSPASGRLVTLSEVPDPVFASEAMGPGAAVWPDDGTVVSPVSGTVSAVLETGHAVGITTEDGAELLVHVGVETVAMEGDGFSCCVREGQRVCAGGVLLTFDRDVIARAGHPDVVMCVALGAPGVELLADPGSAVKAGTPLLRLP